MHRYSSHTPIFRNSPTITSLLKHLIDFVLVKLNPFDSLVLPSFQVLEVSKTADSSGLLDMLFLILIGKYLHALVPLLLSLDFLVIFHAEVLGDGNIFVVRPLYFLEFCVTLLVIGVFGQNDGNLFHLLTFRSLSLIIVLVTLLDQVIAIFP